MVKVINVNLFLCLKNRGFIHGLARTGTVYAKREKGIEQQKISTQAENVDEIIASQGL